MKKIILLLAFMLIGVSSSFAQFEKGKWYLGGGVNGIGFSYDSTSKFSFGLEAHGGYVFASNWMGLANVGFEYTNKTAKNITFGAKCRYLIQQKGFFVQLGAKYAHKKSGEDCCSYDDFLISPEVGYSFFLSNNVTIEPSVYYDMSMTKFSKRSRAGLMIGVAYLF